MRYTQLASHHECVRTRPETLLLPEAFGTGTVIRREREVFLSTELAEEILFMHTLIVLLQRISIRERVTTAGAGFDSSTDSGVLRSRLGARGSVGGGGFSGSLITLEGLDATGAQVFVGDVSAIGVASRYNGDVALLAAIGWHLQVVDVAVHCGNGGDGVVSLKR